jgi:hypothetical protein
MGETTLDIEYRNALSGGMFKLNMTLQCKDGDLISILDLCGDACKVPEVASELTKYTGPYQVYGCTKHCSVPEGTKFCARELLANGPLSLILYPALVRESYDTLSKHLDKVEAINNDPLRKPSYLFMHWLIQRIYLGIYESKTQRTNFLERIKQISRRRDDDFLHLRYNALEGVLCILNLETWPAPKDLALQNMEDSNGAASGAGSGAGSGCGSLRQERRAALHDQEGVAVSSSSVDRRIVNPTQDDISALAARLDAHLLAQAKTEVEQRERELLEKQARWLAPICLTMTAISSLVLLLYIVSKAYARDSHNQWERGL